MAIKVGCLNKKHALINEGSVVLHKNRMKDHSKWRLLVFFYHDCNERIWDEGSESYHPHPPVGIDVGSTSINCLHKWRAWMSNVSHYLDYLSSLKMSMAFSPFISFFLAIQGQYFIVSYLCLKMFCHTYGYFDICFKKKKLKSVT